MELRISTGWSPEKSFSTKTHEATRRREREGRAVVGVRRGESKKTISFLIRRSLFPRESSCVLVEGKNFDGFYSLEQFGFMLQGEFEKRMTAMKIEFFADVGAMFLYRSQADEKLFADFFAGEIFGNEF